MLVPKYFILKKKPFTADEYRLDPNGYTTLEDAEMCAHPGDIITEMYIVEE